MKTITLSEEQKVLYTSQKKDAFFVEVPDMNYLVFDGCGHPSDEDFQVACEALYSISYIIKFEIARKKYATDFKVNPMEVTWYLDKSKERTSYTWSMMIMQPELVTNAMVEEAIKMLQVKGKSIASERVRFERKHFGTCIQCFHKGDYNLMNDTLRKMQEFAKSNEVECEQFTHDIYLNDMRKTKVENYKTIMRTKLIQ